MGILSLSDRPTYFPNVTAGDPELTGMMAAAQAYCESQHGARRPLELDQFVQELNAYCGYLQLPLYPVATIATVEAFGYSRSGFRFSSIAVWSPIDAGAYSINSASGQLRFSYAYTGLVRVTYEAGFDFAVDNADTQLIKSIAGQMVYYLSADRSGSRGGRLDAYLFNPGAADADVESWNFGRSDIYLMEALKPLRRYSPRGF